MNTTVDLVVDSEFGKVYEDIFGLTMDASQPKPEVADVGNSYPKLRPTIVGEVFNRRSVFLKIHWGKVQGTPTLRVVINRVGSRGEEDETLLKFDMTAEPDENGNLKHPRQYVFQALKLAKREFSDKVGCVICGKPDIWFKKIQTPLYPLYQVMFKEIDFANTDNRICRDCEKLVNPVVGVFDPHPESEPLTSYEEVIAAYNLNKFTGKEWYLPSGSEWLLSAVNETTQIHGHERLDSIDFMMASDRHASNLQLGG